MTIKIKIGKPKEEKPVEEKKPIQATIKLKARRSLEGNIMIFDHRDIDIVLMPANSKIVAFPKDEFNDMVYDTQDRLFKYLRKQGIIELGSVQGGNVFMSMEGTIPQSQSYDVVQVALYALWQWIEEERPHFEFQEEYEEKFEDYLTEPDEDETTDWNPARFHNKEKGSIRPNLRPYGIPSVYRW